MKRRAEENVEVPLSPMIDVTFLLIIFFIVTANIQQEVVDQLIKLADSYYIPPPEQTQSLGMTINIRYVEGGEPIYSIAGSRVGFKVIKSRLVKLYKKLGNSVPIVIRASKELPYKYVDQLNDQIVDVGLYRVKHATLSHMQVKKKE
ncbi:MAG: biopolymer transporter ExbD [Lentisphaerae bacterium]|nr:MAG: biopolymer transporter ExbD [Lentisphaerota bacterium]